MKRVASSRIVEVRPVLEQWRPLHRLSDCVSSVSECHSNYQSYLSPKSRAVLKVVNASPIPLSPQQIYGLLRKKRCRINQGLVRKVLGRLAKKGFIQKVCFGLYANRNHGVTLGPVGVGGDERLALRIHAVQLSVPFLRIKGNPGRIEWGFAEGRGHVTILRYRETAQVSIRCDKPYSMSPVECELAASKALESLGFQAKDWNRVKAAHFELNNDAWGLRVDWGKALTLKDFLGNMRRIYNMPYGIRDEVKIVGKRPLSEVIPPLFGGFTVSQIVNGQYVMLEQNAQQTRAVVEAVEIMKKVGAVLLHEPRVSDSRIDIPRAGVCVVCGQKKPFLGTRTYNDPELGPCLDRICSDCFWRPFKNDLKAKDMGEDK